MQNRRHLHLLEGVSEIACNGERAPQTDDMHGARLRQRRNRLVKLAGIDRFQQHFQRRTAGLHEFGKQAGCAFIALLPQMVEPRGVIRPAADIGITEQPLHFRKAGKTHDLAKTHEGRRLHARPFRHFGDGGNGDAILIGGDIIGALPQSFRQTLRDLEQPLLKSLYGFWRLDCRHCRSFVQTEIVCTLTAVEFLFHWVFLGRANETAGALCDWSPSVIAAFSRNPVGARPRSAKSLFTPRTWGGWIPAQGRYDGDYIYERATAMCWLSATRQPQDAYR
ncbi:hypothetical protein AGR7C_Lc30004 [Agrobacterium deltaense Zutra 3/1]|uniref:Uncharacterized protein n=1 Tax=Agrobacterium deltaense Zutra 3/1 TaxID=1183427 RepID=A0A1S7RU41_9HYPH|nr:hypothetical protein AGR7C_Lc30004 [Agrobacterium deltaense Zutra 3/1]